MKNQTKIILIVIILLVIGFMFFYPRMDMLTEKETSTANVAAVPKTSITVEAIELKEERLETNLNITGSLIPNSKLEA
mgnify:FL=1